MPGLFFCAPDRERQSGRFLLLSRGFA